jgi:dTDP-glucose 4,6-dehydratase
MKSPLSHLLVTGGAGFIGSAFIRKVLREDLGVKTVVNVDVLTYAADLENLGEVSSDPRYHFAQVDICDEKAIEDLCDKYKIDTIVHFAAESHVDRSILGPLAFCRTNVEGTLHLLEVVRRRPDIYFHHVSTDEVYGTLGESGSFSEESPIRPNSPYAASKAASDHFVRAYANTYKIKTTISHCSNNFGRGQHPEKLLPLMLRALQDGGMLPVYGDGKNVRDWLYVEDHVDAIWTILKKAAVSECYDLGGGFEASNLEFIGRLIHVFAALTKQSEEPLHQKITFVTDRLGHDFRYSIDPSKIKKDLQWTPRHTFDEALKETVRWYLQRSAHKMCEVSHA